MCPGQLKSVKGEKGDDDDDDKDDDEGGGGRTRQARALGGFAPWQVPADQNLCWRGTTLDLVVIHHHSNDFSKNKMFTGAKASLLISSSRKDS